MSVLWVTGSRGVGERGVGEGGRLGATATLGQCLVALQPLPPPPSPPRLRLLLPQQLDRRRSPCTAHLSSGRHSYSLLNMSSVGEGGAPNAIHRRDAAVGEEAYSSGDSELGGMLSTTPSATAALDASPEADWVRKSPTDKACGAAASLSPTDKACGAAASLSLTDKACGAAASVSLTDKACGAAASLPPLPGGAWRACSGGQAGDCPMATTDPIERHSGKGQATQSGPIGGGDYFKVLKHGWRGERPRRGQSSKVASCK